MNCHVCGGELRFESCPRCAERAANEPAFAGSEDGQWALAANHRVCAIARRAATRPTYAETSPGYRDSMRDAGRGGMVP